MGTVVPISLSPGGKAMYPAKLAPNYAGPWITE